MRKHRDLIGLDFDGTLVSCVDKQIYALKIACTEQHVVFERHDEFWHLKRDGLSTQKALCATGINEVAANDIARRWIEIVESDAACEQDVVLPGVVNALTDLNLHANLLLLSARRDSALLGRQLDSLGLSKFFLHWETVSPLSGVGASKAERLRHHGARCYVGDTESDLAAALTAEIPFICCARGNATESSLNEMPKSLYLGLFTITFYTLPVI